MTVSLTVVVKSRKPYTVFVGGDRLPTAPALAFSPATIRIIKRRCVMEPSASHRKASEKVCVTSGKQTAGEKREKVIISSHS